MPSPLNLKLLILGVSGGAAHVYQGTCSSSFLILKNEQPFCLVDLGLGVTKTLADYGYTLPQNIVITHNHTDHSGELPVVLRVEEAKGNILTIFAENQVAERLKEHRLAEHAELLSPSDLAHWSTMTDDGKLFLDDELYIKFYPSQHSELCFGFVLYRTTASATDQALIGYSADSGHNTSLYNTIKQCNVSIFDARENGNKWHASFDEVAPYLTANSHIIGHGLPNAKEFSELPLLFSGQIIDITESPCNSPTQ